MYWAYRVYKVHRVLAYVIRLIGFKGFRGLAALSVSTRVEESGLKVGFEIGSLLLGQVVQ